MANGGRIDYTIGFKADKSGLEAIKTEINQIMKMTSSDFLKINPNFTSLKEADKRLKEIKNTASQVQDAINNAFNPATGVTNMTKLQESFNQIGKSNITQSFKDLGVVGVKSFNDIAKEALKVNLNFKQTTSILDKMGQTLINTLKWSISSSLINNFAGAFQQAYGYVQHLDTSLNNIRIVTGKSADEMDRFAKTANDAAKSLGQATTDYTEAALIYYQQGLSDEEVQARTETTLKAANVTGQTTKEVSEQLTAVWNGYQVSAENTEEAVDKLAAVAATTAADLEELSTGMSKVAAAANSMGVDMDQLNATIATIESVTRQAPESVGTALKTIYARMGDLQLGKTDEDGLTLGTVSGTLEQVGIHILDVNGELRDMGTVIEEIGEKWNIWTKAEQTAIAEAVAGKRQYNNLFALFDNWDMYNKALETSRNSTGTLQQQQDTYMESTAAHIQQLKTQWEDLYDSVLNTQDINKILSGLTAILDKITNIIDSVGGGKAVLLGTISAVTSIFNKQISKELVIFRQRIKDGQDDLIKLRELAEAYQTKAFDKTTTFAQTKEDLQSILYTMENINVFSKEELQSYQRQIEALTEKAKAEDEYAAKVKELEQELEQYRQKRATELAELQTSNKEEVESEREKTEAIRKKIQAEEEYIKLVASRQVTPGGATLSGSGGVKATRVNIIRDENTDEAKKSLEFTRDWVKDTDSFKSILNDVYDITDKIREKGGEVSKHYQEVFNYAKQAFNVATLDEYVKQIERLEEWLEKLRIATQERQEAEEKGDTEAVKAAKRRVATAKMQISKTIDDLQGGDLTGDLKKVEKRVEKSIKNIEGYQKEYQKEVEKTEKVVEESAEKEKRANENTEKGIKSKTEAIEKQKQAQEELRKKREQESQEVTKQILSEAEVRQRMQAITDITSAITGLIFSFQSLTNIGNILTDDNLTIWQKFGQTITALAFGLPSLIRGLASLNNGLALITGSTKFLTKAQSIKILQDKTETKGILAKTAAYLGLNAAMVPVMITMAALTAGAIALYAVYKNYTKGLQENAEISAETAKLQQEKIDKTKQEKQSIDELLKSYQELLKQKGEDGKFTKDQESQIYNLIKAYGDQELIIQALAGDYENLEQSIKKVQVAQTEQLLQDLDKGEKDYQAALEDAIIANAEASQRDKEGFDLFGGINDTFDIAGQYAFREDLAKLLQSDEDVIDKSGHISYDNLIKLLTTETEDLQKFLEKYKDLDAATQIRTLLNNNRETINSIKDTENQIQAAQLDQLGSLNIDNIDQIDGLTTYIQQIDIMAKKALESGYVDSYEEGREWAKQFVTGYNDSFTTMDMKDSLIQSIAESFKIQGNDTLSEETIISSLAKSFDNISDSGLQAIANHVDLFRMLYNEGWSFDKIVENLSADIDILTNEDHIVKIDAVIDKKFAEEELQELFSDTTFKIPFTKEDFNEIDDSSKYQAIIALRQQEIDAIEEKIELEHINVKERTKALNNQIKAEEEQIKLLREEASTSWHTLKDYKAIAKQIDNYEKSIASAKAELEKFTQYQIDYSKQVDLTKQSIKALNADIDSIQSSYQSLESVVEDYNDDGYLTLDNLQKILELDDAYVASLQIQNGQMSINEETSRAMIDAKLHLAEVEATELYLSELEAIAHNENVIASQNAYNADLVTVSGINQVIEAAGRGVEALMNYAAAKDAASVDYDATKTATEAYYNRMQLIKNVAAQPTKNVLGKADKSKSGSGSKAQEPKQEKYLEREEDILRTINEELEQIESTLGRIQTINDHEWGIDAQKTLEVENELLDKQLEKLEEKRALQEKDLSIRRKQLEYEGVVFSEDGSAMLNAEGQLNALYAHYNTMVDTYNALSAAEQETYKNQLDAEKDRIDKIEKKIDEYESGFSDYQSTLDELLDAHYAEIENEIKLFNNMVDVHLELNDAEKEWDDFWYDVVQDVQDTDFGGQIAKSMAKLETLVGTTINNTDSDVSVLTNHLLDTIAEVQAQIASANRGGEDSLFGDDTLASKENLENYRDKLMEALKAAKDEIDNISETYLKMLDDAQDKIDEQVDGWNSIGDQIQHDLDLIKLVSGEKAFNAFENFLNQQYQNDLNLINTQKQSKDFWKEEIDRYTQLLEVTDKNTVQWKTYSEALKKASENYRKAVQDLDKTVEEALKHLDEWRTNQVNAISTALDNAMSGGLGLETVEQEWKLINDYADKYLDNVERALDMEEYTNILNEAADAIGLSAANQEKLNRFRDEELKKLNEKEKLTSYDIDESKARLEILKQQMALEDAQRNKSNMRLRRDNQGNYVYQYVSNEEELEKAGQGTLTAKREWYELVKKRWKETSDWIIESEKQQANLLQQIDEAEKNGEIETANKLKELYKLNQQDIVNAYAEAEKNKQDLYLGTAQYFDYVDNAAILPNSKATVRQLVNEWVGGDGQEGFVTAVNTAITKLEETQNKYAERTAVILTEAGIQYQQLKENGVDPTIDSLSEMVDTNEELRYTLDDVNDALRQQENNLYQCEMAYHRLRDAAANAVYAANSALNSLAQTAINTVQRVQAAVQAAQSASRITASSLMSGSSLGSGVGSGLQNGSSYASSNTTTSKYRTTASYQGVGKGSYTTATVNKNANTVLYAAKNKNLGTNGVVFSPLSGWDNISQQIQSLLPSLNDLSVGDRIKYIRNLIGFNAYNTYRNTIDSILSSFATGGYTGAWGDSGKLAILHQKELVLNQDDTANMLKAVEALREITNNQGSISGIADTILRTSNIQAQALANVGAGLFQQLANMVNTSNTSTTRNMTVNADFSGVRSADAIYQALMELQNYGLQQNYSVDPMSSTPY